MKKVFSVLAAMLLATAVSPVYAELSQDGLIAVEHFNKLATIRTSDTCDIVEIHIDETLKELIDISHCDTFALFSCFNVFSYCCLLFED